MSGSVPFDDVLASFLEARDRGEDAALDTWIARHPEHAVEMRAYLESEGWFDELAEAIRTPGGTRGGAARVIAPPVIAGYTILREIARGGMGVVFEAEQHTPRRTVALKTLRDAVLATDEDVRRFRREAQAAAELDHPGIVKILALGEVDGRIWFTMPLAAGGSLAEHLTEVVGDHTRAAQVVRDVARAVAHGHARGILHRDLKPSNVLLDARGVPHVTDFGLARRLERGDEHHTQTGTVLGTPAYMAPEQARGDLLAIDERTDIWGLGVILYQLLSGRPPFVGSGPGDTINRVLNASPPAILDTAPGVPRALAVICETCMHKRPADRYASMRDLADDLDSHLLGRPIRARRPGWAGRALLWTRRRPTIAALGVVSVAAVLALAAALWFAQRGDTEERRRRAGDLLATARHRSEEGDLVGAGLFFAASDVASPSWVARRGLAAHATPVPLRIEVLGSATLWRVRYGPAGRKLAVGDDKGRVHLWEAERRLGTLEHEGHAVRGLAFDAAGSRLATGAENGVLRVWDLSTRTESARVELGVGAPDRAIPALVWLDEQTVAAGCSDGAVYVWHIAGGPPRKHAAETAGVRVASLAASPDGTRLLVGHGEVASKTIVGAVCIEVASGHVVGRFQRHRTAVWDCAWHPDGTTVATAGDESAAIWSIEPLRLLHKLRHDAPVGALAFSADGERLITGTTAGSVRAFDTATGLEIGRPRPHTGAVYGVAVNPVTGTVATVGVEATLRTWPSPAGPAPWYRISGPSRTYHVVASGTAGQRMLVFSSGGTSDGVLAMRRTQGGKLLASVPLAHPHRRDHALALTANDAGWLLLVRASGEAGDERAVQLVQVVAAERALTLRRGPVVRLEDDVAEASFAPEAGVVVVRSRSLLRVVHLRPEVTLRPGRLVQNVEGWALSPSGQWLVHRHVDDGRRFTVQQAADGGQARTHELEGEISRVAVSDDGQRAALAMSNGQSILTYDVRTGRVLATIRQLDVYALRFAASGSVLLAGSVDGRVRMWDTGTGMPVGRALDVAAVTGAGILRFIVDAGEKTLITVGAGGDMVSWDVAWMGLRDTESGWSARRRAAGLAAGQRIGPEGQIIPLDPVAWRNLRGEHGR